MSLPPGRSRRIGALLLLALLVTSCGLRPPSTGVTPLNTSTPAQETSTPRPVDQGAALLPGQGEIPAGLAHYSIQLDLDYSGHTFRGHSRVDFTNTEHVPLESVYFRLYPNAQQTYGDGRLTVSQVTVDGQRVQLILSEGDSVLELPLPQALPVGGRTQIELDFAGLVPVDFGGADGGGYGIYNYSDGVLALAGWYPILAVFDLAGWRLDPVYPVGDAVFSDVAVYTVEVTTAEEVILAASGVELERQVGDSQARHLFASGPARDFFLVASLDFQVLSAAAGGTSVNAYYLPGDEDGARVTLEATLGALEAFNARFGTYPYTELDMVETPLNVARGVEYPGITLMASRLYSDHQSPDFRGTIAHEVAHQWWYNLVGNDVIAEPWLDEALATYSMGLYFEHTEGEAAYDQVVDYWLYEYEYLVEEGNDDQVSASLPHFAQLGSGRHYSTVVYTKGALFLHALRQEIGDEGFFSALQRYYQEQRYQVASGEDLLAAFEAAAGQDLGALYQAWLYSSSPAPVIPTATPAPTATPTPLPPTRFAVIGDYGMGNQPAGDVASLVLSWDSDFIITTGDNNYLYGSAKTIDDNIGQFYHSYIYPYAGRYGEGATTNRFFPSLGNHDWISDDGGPYLDYFSLPGNERYYDFTWGPLHFFALNNTSGEPDGIGLSSTQASWLRAGLATSTSPWKIVYMHYPPYSSAYHGSTDWAQWPYQAWGATAVLAGHDHTYERLLVDGIPYFVNGLGGGGIYDFEETLSGSAVRFNADYGAMLVEATPDWIVFQFVSRGGSVVDIYTIKR